MLDASAVKGIVDHMNEDHADAVLLYAQAIAQVVDATAARMTDLDSDGMRLEVQTHAGTQSVEIAFEVPLTDRVHAREALVELVKEARMRLDRGC